MATPARNLIVENVATVLATITTGNGYKTTVDTVSRTVKWKTVGAQEMPWLGFNFPSENFAYHPFGEIDVRMHGNIVGVVAGSTAALRADNVSDLQDDVIAALSLDPTRGGNAVCTTFGRPGPGLNDEGSDHTMDHRGGAGTFILPVEVFYIRTTSSS